LRFIYIPAQVPQEENPLDTPAYCYWLPLLEANNPDALGYDPNPNILTEDCTTDLADLAVWAAVWLDSLCAPENSWCADGDLNHDGAVDMSDWIILSWLWQP